MSIPNRLAFYGQTYVWCRPRTNENGRHMTMAHTRNTKPLNDSCQTTDTRLNDDSFFRLPDSKAIQSLPALTTAVFAVSLQTPSFAKSFSRYATGIIYKQPRVQYKSTQIRCSLQPLTALPVYCLINSLTSLVVKESNLQAPVLSKLGALLQPEE